MSTLPGGISLRTFRPQDQSAARALVLSGMEEHWGTIDRTMNPDLDNIAQAYASSTFLLAWEGRELIGTGALVEERDGVARIVRMSVAARMRRRGVGALILAGLLERAQSAGYDSVVLETEEDWVDAIAFYESCGFRVTDRHDGGVQMVLDLG